VGEGAEDELLPYKADMSNLKSQNARSSELFARAQRVIPGGVNSPVRAFREVGGEPAFAARGEGGRIWDADGNEYLDCLGSWGPLILGHAHPAVVAAVQAAVVRGTSFGVPTELEVEFAERLAEAAPSVEMVRLVNSGTEAVMSALRLARAYTGRDLIAKFAGGYHGHSDSLLAQAGSALAAPGVPTTPGVPEAVVAQTLVLPYNDLEAARQAFARVGERLAAVIVEPVAGNMGVVPPAEGFLAGLRELTPPEAGALLIFDEVITGFRVAYGGAQSRYGVIPDLTTLGKVIGGGFPIGAYGGRREIMEMMAPAGPVFQAGTLSGNPVAVTAGLTTLAELRRPGVYEALEERGAALARGLSEAAGRAGAAVQINRVGSMLTVFFTDSPVTDFASAKRSDLARFARFFHGMRRRGVLLPPSQFEAWFLSAAHTPQDIERIVSASAEAFGEAAPDP
jgi:glutamate-1-semialdehyde 2,1-aminomutase